MTYSKILSLISGLPQTADLSLASNIFAVSNFQFLGSTSGNIQHKANAVTTPYTVIWPAAQAASSGYALINDGAGNLSWAAAASPLTFANSLVNTGGTVALVNDSATPGASKYYGTNSSSTLGYFSLPASTPGGTTGQVQYNNSGVFGGFGSWNGTTLAITGAISSTTTMAVGTNLHVFGTSIMAGDMVVQGGASFSGNLGFYGASEISQPTGNIFTALSNLGLVATPTMALTNLPAQATGTALANISGSSATPTAVTLTSAATVSSIVLRDVNANIQVNNLGENVAVTATAAGTTTLVVGSAYNQTFTGTATQTIKLPVSSTMIVGQGFLLNNQSSQSLTVQFQDATAFADAAGISYATVYPHQTLTIVLQTNGTSNGTWSVSTNTAAGISLIQPTVQKFLSGSGTYTTPANVAYITVEMVGGGGGGAGSGTGSGSAGGGSGGTGGATSFGTSLLTTTGGVGGIGANAHGLPAGGTATVNSPAIQVIATTGGVGSATAQAVSGAFMPGVAGASSPFGGAGSGDINVAAIAAAPNTGSGGGCAGDNSSINAQNSSGAAGGYIKAIITNPALTYSYTIGAAGTGGTAGTSGFTGGAGGSGVIIVTEYYNQTIASGVTVTASTAPTITVLTSGSSTYTPPRGVQYIEVEMAGGGGGGGGGANNGSSGGTGGNGTSTTFGTSFLTCTGGTGGAWAGGGASGGTATIGTGANGVAFSGGPGGGSSQTIAATSPNDIAGGMGGTNPFGGAGGPGGGGFNQAGTPPAPNTGAGGAGATSGPPVGTNAGNGGGGGGAGGYLKATINNPNGPYSYTIGAAGTAGTSVGTAAAPSAGAAGIIIIREYYTALATGGFSGGGANVPTVQKFLTGSGTYTTPANVTWVEVEMVGGGGGGASAGNTAATAATAGGNTTFGTGTANGGGAAIVNSTPGVGGTATLGTGWIGTAISGATGSVGGSGSSQIFSVSTPGANSALGGGGGTAGAATQTGGSGVANTGGGGGGGGAGASAVNNGSSGGAGGYIKAIITNPISTYSYSVGTAGGAGTSSSLASGGAGGSGYIRVTEYYANGAVGTATSITGKVTASNCTIPTRQIFTSGTSQTYTTPTSPAPLYLKVTVVGGGGSGGAGALGGGGSGGGGGGGTSTSYITSPLSTYTYTVGAAGTSGGVGGTTSFASLASATGGGAGGGNSVTIGGAGGAGGIGSLGSINLVGSAGSYGSGAISGVANGNGGNGGASVGQYGGGGGFGGGPSNTGSTPGSAGGNYGGGGGGQGGFGTGSAGANAAGGVGIIVVEEFYQ